MNAQENRGLRACMVAHSIWSDCTYFNFNISIMLSWSRIYIDHACSKRSPGLLINFQVSRVFTYVLLFSYTSEQKTRTVIVKCWGEGEEPLVGFSKSSISLYIFVIFIIACMNHSMHAAWKWCCIINNLSTRYRSISWINDTTAMLVIILFTFVSFMLGD